VYSNVVNILAAQTPSAPLLVKTEISALNVKISWTAPSSNGSPITGYMVYIQQSDLATFSVDSTNCDLSNSNSTQCLVPINVLRSSVYKLPWGSSVYAYVEAYNAYGKSA
jgi:hypothetical protein